MGLLSFPAENPRREENLQGKLHIAHNEWELKQHLQQETVILPTGGGTSNEILQKHPPSDIRICESKGPAFLSVFLEFTCEWATGRPPSKTYLTLLWARNKMDCPEK